ncbi:phosphoribosylanthranilate isomerase [Candidatus Woesearchaeota archaeon]|nr:phosphoribosylanthranilate isomerase [Candidatus Woesearchaeota archaeon]
MTKIKICGITNYEDAKNSVDLGADFLGFNFYIKSPRFVDYKEVQDIIKKINGRINIVGVFANEPIENIKKIDKTCNLDFIQLSGDETAQYVKELKNSINKKIIKCFHIKNFKYIKQTNDYKYDYLMLDSFKDGLYGGTGKTIDLDLIKNVNKKNLFLAGGLNAKNAKTAIKKINPFAVDVCSCIESKPGKKDYIKMKKFIEAVKCRKF